MKKIISTLLIVLSLFSLVACREDKKPMNTEPEKIDSLIGTWTETNPIDFNLWYEISITEDSICIWHCSGTTYDPVRKKTWEGTFEDIKEPSSEYSFESEDIDTDTHSANTRTFTYKNGLLSVEKVRGWDYDITTRPIIECKKLETETN